MVATFNGGQTWPYSRDASAEVARVQNLALPSIDDVIGRARQSLTTAVQRFDDGLMGIDALRIQAQGILRRGTLAALATVNDSVEGVSAFSDRVITAAQRVLANVFEATGAAIAGLATGVRGAGQALIATSAALYAVGAVASMQMAVDDNGGTDDLEERRVLGASNSCADCSALASLGWQPFGTLPEPGQDSVCGAYCRCRVEVRNGEEGQSNGVVR